MECLKLFPDAVQWALKSVFHDLMIAPALINFPKTAHAFLVDKGGQWLPSVSHFLLQSVNTLFRIC